MAPFFGNPLALGRSLGSGQNLVWMTAAERARHLYIVGATRTGKSKQLEDCIRQDILAWPRSGCGLMVLDRHGSLYDNLIGWSAAQDLSAWPIVPIDLRRDDWIVSYNPLRRRGGGEDPGVVVGNFVRSILHAWDQSNLSDTPRLVKWLEATLLVLHGQGFTLAEALQFIVRPKVRHAMTRQVEDFVLKCIWDSAPMREVEFQEMVESTVNRIRRFLSRRVMRATLGQSDVSLDLGTALEEGQIILVSLATEGGKIDDEDASTFGSLILSDLWMTAKARGKREEGYVRPFYVYLDEFQEYLSPTMAETLDQTSGFGLHMTLAHQFPSQLLRSKEGEQVYNSVMTNCRNKILFQLDHNEDLEALALMLFRQEVDAYKVKNEIWSTKVLGHRIEYFGSYSNGVNSSVGGGTSRSLTRGKGRTLGSNWSHTDGVNESTTETDTIGETRSEEFSTTDSHSRGTSSSRSRSRGTSEGTSEATGTGWGDSEGESSARSSSAGETWGRSASSMRGGSKGTSRSRSQTHSFGHPSDDFQEDLEEYLDGELLDEEDEDRFKRRANRFSLTEGEGESEGEAWSDGSSSSSGGSRSESQTQGLSRSRSRSGSLSHGTSRGRNLEDGWSDGISSAESRAVGRSTGTSLSTSHSIARTFGTSSSDTYGESEAETKSIAWTDGDNDNWSQGRSQSVTHSPLLIPIMGKQLSSITYESIEEQLFAFAQYLAGQRDRQAVVKLVGMPPVAIVTRTVKPGLTMPEWTFEWATLVVQGLSFALPMAKALETIAKRHAAMMDKLLALPSSDEPTSSGRPVAMPTKFLPAPHDPRNGRGKRRA